MKDITGKKFTISGMTIEVICDAGDKWETRNTTTQETILMDKGVLESAIRLGKAEELTEPGGQSLAKKQRLFSF